MFVRAIGLTLLTAALWAQNAPKISPRAEVEGASSEARLGFGDQEGRPLAWGRDLDILDCSGEGRFQFKALAFVGYGLASPGHDDLGTLELKGRVALMLRHVPEQGPLSKLPTEERDLSARLARVIQAGVAAVLVIEEGETPAPPRPGDGGNRCKVPVLSVPLRTPATVCPDLEARVKRLKGGGGPQSQDYVRAPWSYMNLRLALRRGDAAPSAHP